MRKSFAPWRTEARICRGPEDVSALEFIDIAIGYACAFGG
jgi:hypothetical protein